MNNQMNPWHLSQQLQDLLLQQERAAEKQMMLDDLRLARKLANNGDDRLLMAALEMVLQIEKKLKEKGVR
jgi:hypothetical protein